ncbi:hypothetical protein D3C76_945740 [compost metagenome]
MNRFSGSSVTDIQWLQVSSAAQDAESNNAFGLTVPMALTTPCRVSPRAPRMSPSSGN